MKFNVGEKVILNDNHKETHGLIGIITRIDGEYHYVEVQPRDWHERVEFEMYRSEIKKIDISPRKSAYINLYDIEHPTKDKLDDDLFTL